MKVEYHPDTVSDLNEAIEYYNHQRDGLGFEFRQEVYSVIDRIIADPLIYRPVKNKIRRCFVHRFPFSVLYRVVGDETVRILIIRHHRQHPQFGDSRR